MIFPGSTEEVAPNFLRHRTQAADDAASCARTQGTAGGPPSNRGRRPISERTSCARADWRLWSAREWARTILGKGHL